MPSDDPRVRVSLLSLGGGRPQASDARQNLRLRRVGARRLGARVASELLYRSGLATAIGRRHAGLGTIFLFHRVATDNSILPALNSDMFVTAGFLEAWLAHLRQRGVDVVALDEAVRRVQDLPHARPERRFVAIAFDDGYADVVRHALPVLEKFAAPFTVYVTTSLVDRSSGLWWLGLERLVQSHDVVEVAPMGPAGRRFDTSSLARKADALRQVCRWVWADVERRAPLLRGVFERHGVSAAAATAAVGLSPEHLRALARHPLATIGGHTTSHPCLPSLSEARARSEIMDNKAYLEDACDGAVEHFAYPYGAGGNGQAALVSAAGFKTAVTNQQGCLFPAHRDQLLLLPRYPCTGARMWLGYLHAQRCGVWRFVKSGAA